MRSSWLQGRTDTEDWFCRVSCILYQAERRRRWVVEESPSVEVMALDPERTPPGWHRDVGKCVVEFSDIEFRTAALEFAQYPGATLTPREQLVRLKWSTTIRFFDDESGEWPDPIGDGCVPYPRGPTGRGFDHNDMTEDPGTRRDDGPEGGGDLEEGGREVEQHRAEGVSAAGIENQTSSSPQSLRESEARMSRMTLTDGAPEAETRT
jgi:hypothetical protein